MASLSDLAVIARTTEALGTLSSKTSLPSMVVFFAAVSSSLVVLLVVTDMFTSQH